MSNINSNIINVSTTLNGKNPNTVYYATKLKSNSSIVYSNTLNESTDYYSILKYFVYFVPRPKAVGTYPCILRFFNGDDLYVPTKNFTAANYYTDVTSISKTSHYIEFNANIDERIVNQTNVSASTPGYSNDFSVGYGLHSAMIAYPSEEGSKYQYEISVYFVDSVDGVPLVDDNADEDNNNEEDMNNTDNAYFELYQGSTKLNIEEYNGDLICYIKPNSENISIEIKGGEEKQYTDDWGITTKAKQNHFDNVLTNTLTNDDITGLFTIAIDSGEGITYQTPNLTYFRNITFVNGEYTNEKYIATMTYYCGGSWDSTNKKWINQTLYTKQIHFIYNEISTKKLDALVLKSNLNVTKAQKELGGTTRKIQMEFIKDCTNKTLMKNIDGVVTFKGDAVDVKFSCLLTGFAIGDVVTGELNGTKTSKRVTDTERISFDLSYLSFNNGNNAFKVYANNSNEIEYTFVLNQQQIRQITVDSTVEKDTDGNIVINNNPITYNLTGITQGENITIKIGDYTLSQDEYYFDSNDKLIIKPNTSNIVTGKQKITITTPSLVVEDNVIKGTPKTTVITDLKVKKGNTALTVDKSNSLIYKVYDSVNCYNAGYGYDFYLTSNETIELYAEESQEDDFIYYIDVRNVSNNYFNVVINWNENKEYVARTKTINLKLKDSSNNISNQRIDFIIGQAEKENKTNAYFKLESDTATIRNGVGAVTKVKFESENIKNTFTYVKPNYISITPNISNGEFILATTTASPTTADTTADILIYATSSIDNSTLPVHLTLTRKGKNVNVLVVEKSYYEVDWDGLELLNIPFTTSGSDITSVQITTPESQYSWLKYDNNPITNTNHIVIYADSDTTTTTTNSSTGFTTNAVTTKVNLKEQGVYIDNGVLKQYSGFTNVLENGGINVNAASQLSSTTYYTPDFSVNTKGAFSILVIDENDNENDRTAKIKVAAFSGSTKLTETEQEIVILQRGRMKSYQFPLWKKTEIAFPLNGNNYISYKITHNDTLIYKGALYGIGDYAYFIPNDILKDYISSEIDFNEKNLFIENGFGMFKVYISYNDFIDTTYYCNLYTFNDWSYSNWKDDKWGEDNYQFIVSHPISGIIDARQRFLVSTFNSSVNPPYSFKVVVDLLRKTAIGLRSVKTLTRYVTSAGISTLMQDLNEMGVDYDYIRVSIFQKNKESQLDNAYYSYASQEQIYKLNKCDDYRYCLYYLNDAGGWDSILLKGKVKATETLKINTFGDRYHTKHQYLKEITDKWSLNTGFITDIESSRMKYLLNSVDVWLHDLENNNIIPVNITDTQYERKEWKNIKKPYSYTFNIENREIKTNYK